MSNELGTTILRRRKDLGLTQAALAKELGVSQQTVARWERGGSTPSDAVLTRLSLLLGREDGLTSSQAGRVVREEPVLPPPVRPLMGRLPLDELTPTDFERFTHALASALYPEAHVHRVGGPGHDQSGADVIAENTDEGRVALQCKRVSRDGRFGPAKVERTVAAAADLEADKRIIVLSRVASPKAREVAMRNGWLIWDHDDIVYLLQIKLAGEQARRIVRAFFPGYANDLLGLSSAGPWLTLEEMYAGQLEGEGLFSHVWPLLGREGELFEVQHWLDDPDDASFCRLVVGPAGIGKSRLLIELARRTSRDQGVWFVDSDVEVRPEDFDSLDDGPVLLIVDDAHDRQDVEIIVRGAVLRNSRTRTCVLLATRPYGEERLVRVISPLHRGVLPQPTALKALSRSDAKMLAAQVLEASADSTLVQRIAAVARDSTMLTVATAFMFKESRIDPALLASADEFRRIVLEAWVEQHDRALTDLPAAIDPRDFLRVLAAAQPLELENSEHLSDFAALLGTDRIDDVVRALERAVATGVAIRRAGRIRLMPDMLADYILADACFSTRLSRATGFADRAWRTVSAGLRRNLLANLSRVDWQLSASRLSPVSLIDTAWSSLETDFHNGGIQDRSALLSILAEVSYYQPQRSLELVRWAIDNPIEGTETGFLGQALTYADVLEMIPKVLRDCAYHLEHLEESLDPLWELAKADKRPTNPHPDHPLRVLSELASLSLLKPFDYSRRVIEHAIGWLEQDPHSAVFTVLEEAVKWDAEDHLAEGLTINMRSYSSLEVANEQDVLTLRRLVIDACVKAVNSEDIGVALAASRTLASAWRNPGGLFGRTAKEPEVHVWEKETASILRSLATSGALNDLSPVVKAELMVAVEHLARTGPDTVQQEARAILDTVGEDLDVEIAEALLHGPWRRELRKANGGSIDAEQRWLKSVADRLFDREKTADAVVELLEGHLDAISSTGGAASVTPDPLVAALVELGEGVAEAIAARIGRNPQSTLSAVAGTALSVARRKHPSDVLEIAQKLLGTGDDRLRRQVAYAYGWGLGSAPRIGISEDEILLIRQLAADDDIFVVRNIARSLRFLAVADPSLAVRILLELRISRSPDLADDTLVLFAKSEPLSLEHLDESSLEQILGELLVCPSIDEYWVEQFLGHLCEHNLARVVELVRARVERAEQCNCGHDEYRPLPFGWEDKSPLSTAGHPSRLRVLRELREWAAAGIQNWRRSWYGPRLFAAVVGEFDDEALSVLEEGLSETPLPEAKRTAHLLSELPKSVIWNRVPWISRVLEAALRRDSALYKTLSSALYSAVISGTRWGTPGQPYPQDIEQRDRARAIADGLPPGSAAERFYRNLQRSAEAEIARKVEEDEELL